MTRAIFALPDKGLLSRAEPNRPEVEAALAAHFGRPVPLRLVLDEPGPVAELAGRPEPPACRRPQGGDSVDFDDLERRSGGGSVARAAPARSISGRRGGVAVSGEDEQPVPDLSALLSKLGEVQQNLQQAQESAAARVLEGTLGVAPCGCAPRVAWSSSRSPSIPPLSIRPKSTSCRI